MTGPKKKKNLKLIKLYAIASTQIMAEQSSQKAEPLMLWYKTLKIYFNTKDYATADSSPFPFLFSFIPP